MRLFRPAIIRIRRRLLPGSRWGALAALLLPVAAQAQWRSSLYPENWLRPTETTSFYTDKLIQDFSYAGYKSGAQAIPSVSGPVHDVTSPTYGADSTGATDSTVAIQNAITAAGDAGGGVVYLPAGTYRISPQGANAYCLRISKSNVVLRGAGATSTYLLNTATNMRGKSVIDIRPASTSTGSSVLLSADVTGPTRRLPVATPSTFAVGDIVKILWDVTDAWVVEHGQQTWWNATDGYPSSAEYLREVVAVNQAQGWIEVDVPTRYTMKTRDNARVAKFSGQLTGTGVESLAIGNVQNPGTTWAENDYAVAGTAAYEVHDCYLIDMAYLRDAWVSGVRSYQPAGNTTTCHMLSNGISLVSSHRVTVKDCVMGRPQYGGGGGNGYMYRLQRANDCLVQSCTSDLARHGFVVSHAGTSGNVFLQCNDREAGRALGSSSTPYTTSGSGSDNHMHFSHSNLWDSCTAYNAYFTAHHRTVSGTVPHGLTSAHGVYWNTSGSGTRYNEIVRSEQGRYGYVIGTSGSKSGVTITSGSTNNTLPTDHSEGVGTGATLSPASLYLDQLERRLRPVVTYKGNGSTDGTVPSDGNNPYGPGTTVTILGAGTMTRTGYTFAGWNTLANGTGTNYAATATFPIDNHLTLYAKWTPVTTLVTFDKQGGTGGSSSVTATYGSAMPPATAPTRDGWIFGGYYSAIQGGGTQYYNAAMASATPWNLTSDTTLYAYWTSSATVSFDANGGTTPSPASMTVTTGAAYGTLATTSRVGYTFKGWYTAATGGTAVTGATTVTEVGNHTLYAQWTTGTTAAAAAKHFIRGEAENTTTHPLGYYASPGDLIGVAGGSGSRYDHNVVFAYTLPTLPVGATLDGAAFNFEITVARDSTGNTNLPDLHVYLLDSADPTSSGTGFYYHGAADPNGSAKYVGAATPKPTITGTADNTFTPAESRSITLSGAALNLLKSYY
ncbi:MAG TPA: InlB B-repeat-containing protein, partial [Luteolibacter sp.]|nr:InlB B-repeat-containing protein [Luteolibacter sp.]